MFTSYYRTRLSFLLVVFGEGDICPFIGFIKSGHCEVYKSVEAIKNFGNHQIKMKRQVCMGTLQSGDSIGETSLLFDEVLPCTVITRSALDMGVIKEERLKGAFNCWAVRSAKCYNLNNFYRIR